VRDLLLEYTKDFKVSRPIFYLQVAQSGGIIDAQRSVFKYKPTPSVKDDVVADLMCNVYTEHFNIERGAYEIDIYDIAERAARFIYAEIPKFIEQEMKLKNPKQSKLYKWAYLIPKNNTELDKGILLLYRYMHHSVYDDSIPATERSAHAANIIALLEAMMEKYGEQV
jgi:hypothetical protein